MRILIVSNLFPPSILGGYEILCAQVCDRLQRRGHEVYVLSTPCDREESFPYIVNRSLALYLPFGQPAALQRWRRAVVSRRNEEVTRKLIGRYQPDVVFCWSQLRLTLGAAIAAEATNTTVAYTMNDEHLTGYRSTIGGWRGALRTLVDHHVLRIDSRRLQLAHVSCISKLLKDRLCEAGHPLGRASVHYQGIPVEDFACKSVPGRIGSPLKVLYVGQLHAYKGVHTVIEAMAELAKQDVAAELTICGAGDAAYESHLRQAVSELGVVAHFLGKVERGALPAIYRSKDILVFPSIWSEPFGLTHLEAMASGTPVISTRKGGQSEFLVDGSNALTFEPGDAKQLAERMLLLVSTPALAERLARSARKLVEESFSLDAYVDRLEWWLKEIAVGQKLSETPPIW